ncbi:MAG: lactonase family protein [Planctomycetaceae bacterium]|nr:lactonase family protein [Planctomycetaceae bacterium]
MSRTPRCWLCCLVSSAVLLTLMGLLQADDRPTHDDYLVYIGTYTRGSDSQGIYRMRLDAATGEMTDLQLAGKSENPSFLAIRPDRSALYAVSEIEQLEGRPTGGLAAFTIDQKNGNLSPLNVQPTGGTGPCYVTTDTSGSVALVANYGGGSVASFRIARDGSLQSAASMIQHAGSSLNPRRQEGPHAHSIVLSPDGSRAYAPDLGLDQIRIYRVDAEAGTLTPNEAPYAAVAPGAGPRHFDFHPSGRFAYVINELASTITAFSHDAGTGALTELQTVSSLPNGDVPGNSTADIHVHPNGRFLYGSNRGHNSIAVFAIDPETGMLTHVQHQSTLGEIPRNFGIDPTGRILLAENQQSGTIYSFRIDPETGELTETGHKIEVPRPVCIRFAAWPL